MFFLRLLSHLPFSILYAISDFLFVMSYYVIRYRRRMVIKNLTHSFPDKSIAEIKQIEKKFYKNLCDYAVETLKLLTISKEELSKRMKFENLHVVQNYAKQNQSILFLASHQFNWEWMLVSASVNFPFQIDFVYQPVQNELFEKFSRQCRTRFGAHAILRQDVARELVKRKDILRGIATVADQYPGYKKDKKYATQFLNQETVFFLGTNSMAILAQYPALYSSLRKIKRGYYVATLHVIGQPPFEKTSLDVIENYVRAVEKLIKEEPDGWLWSHNRWKKRHIEGSDIVVRKEN